MRLPTRRTLAALGIVGVLGAGAALPALAQDGSEPEVTEDTTLGELRELREQRRAAHHEEFAAALAEELGTDTEAVLDALEAVRTEMHAARQAERQARLEERLDAAVADGDLTREQADAILEAHEDGMFGHGFGVRGHHGPRGGFGGFGRGPGAPDAG